MTDFVIGQVATPNVQGMSREVAQQAIIDAFLTPIEGVALYEGVAALDTVAEQSPAPTTLLDPYSAVTFRMRLAAPLPIDIASVQRIPRTKVNERRQEEKQEDEERRLVAIMAAVEAEKMAAALHASEAAISAPEPQYTALQMLPVRFRGRK